MGISNRGFTRTDIVALVILVPIILFLVAGIFLTPHGSRSYAAERMATDIASLESQARALSSWASQHNGNYPIPSDLDRHDATVAEQGQAKNTSANTWSLLIYAGLIDPEQLVSASEVNGMIEPVENYSYAAPPSAVEPERALWDPAFRADFTEGAAHLSFASTPYVGERSAHWSTKAPSLEYIVGNRGPRVVSIDGRRYIDTESNTLLIHGGRRNWFGAVAFGDGHVETVSRPWHHNTNNDDHLFFDEPDRPTNAFLGIWTTAGETMDKHTFIWD